MNMSSANQLSARQRLLEAASRLFYAGGVVGTGIDAITTEAGVAKKSLYNNFASKEDLVLAYIEARHDQWLELYQIRRAQALNPNDQVLAVFDAYTDHASAGYEHGFRGCGLLNAAAELPVGSPGREAVRRHKVHVEQILAEHLKESHPEPEALKLAEHLAFLLEGAMSRAGLEGEPERLLHARQIANNLLGNP